jgi:hypothetical protein
VRGPAPADIVSLDDHLVRLLASEGLTSQPLAAE